MKKAATRTAPRKLVVRRETIATLDREQLEMVNAGNIITVSILHGPCAAGAPPAK